MKPRILIVDDDEAITQQLFWTLSDDYDVVTANDMQTAVRRATIYEPVVSILDLHLPPEVDSPEVGLRILKYIKSHLPDSKVLVMSSASGIETRLFKGTQLNRFVNVYLNDEDIRFLKNLDTPVKEGDEISIIPAIAGGTCPSIRHRR